MESQSSQGGYGYSTLLIHWNLGFADLGIDKDSEDAKSMAGWSLETWKKLVSFLQKGVIYIDIPRNSISGLRFIDPDDYFIIHTAEDDESA
jgi:hypothetical protein